jgi:NTE family protein
MNGGDFMSIGLVLSGGGAKGAYQIGAWKALCEVGYNDYIDVYSGSSVGAINCFLIQMMSWQEAANIWLNYDLSRAFFTDGIELDSLVKTIRSILLGKKLKNESLFTRDGLIELFNKIGFNRLDKSKLDCYATVANVTEIPEDIRALKTALDWYGGKKSGFTQYIHIKNADDEFIKAVLLATSAIPIIYPVERIGDQYYVDGAINDNLPIYPIYKRGIKSIIAVACDRVNYQNLKRKFPSCDIMLIQPSKYLGNMISGTLNFNNSKLLDTFQLGYTDAWRTIRKSMVYSAKC